MFASTPAPVLPNLRLASGKPPLTKAAASNTEAEVFSDKPGLVYDERMMAHEDTTDPDHPEQPARISACFEELQRAGLVDGCKRFPVRNAMAFELESVHTPSWIKKVRGRKGTATEVCRAARCGGPGMHGGEANRAPSAIHYNDNDEHLPCREEAQRPTQTTEPVTTRAVNATFQTTTHHHNITSFPRRPR